MRLFHGSKTVPLSLLTKGCVPIKLKRLYKDKNRMRNNVGYITETVTVKRSCYSVSSNETARKSLVNIYCKKNKKF